MLQLPSRAAMVWDISPLLTNRTRVPAVTSARTGLKACSLIALRRPPTDQAMGFSTSVAVSMAAVARGGGPIQRTRSSSGSSAAGRAGTSPSRANAQSSPPTAMETNCSPSIAYEAAGPGRSRTPGGPAWKPHSRSPVPASYASIRPSAEPQNIKPPAVVSGPLVASRAPRNSFFQTTSPVRPSTAARMPVDSGSVSRT